MGLFRQENLRDEKACYVRFSGDYEIVLGKTAAELSRMRNGWHGPWTVVVLRQSNNNKVLRAEKRYVNLAAASSMGDMTVKVEV